MNNNCLPLLYSFRRCPYAMRARMAIHTAGIAVETVEVSLKNKPQDLLHASPKGTVPVVVTAQGQVLEQSRDIMLWALHQSDPLDWLMKNNPIAQQQMTQLIDTCDIDFKPQLDRYKYFDRYPQYSQEKYREQSEWFLQKLETLLNLHSFLIDDQMRLADAAIFPFIRQFAGVDESWFARNHHPNLRRWLNNCVTSDVFAAIMKK